jgi:hypothetical protein
MRAGLLRQSRVADASPASRSARGAQDNAQSWSSHGDAPFHAVGGLSVSRRGLTVSHLTGTPAACGTSVTGETSHLDRARERGQRCVLSGQRSPGSQDVAGHHTGLQSRHRAHPRRAQLRWRTTQRHARRLPELAGLHAHIASLMTHHHSRDLEQWRTAAENESWMRSGRCSGRGSDLSL